MVPPHSVRLPNSSLTLQSHVSLAAPAGTPAAHAPVATPIPRHDAAAEAAGRGVAQVDEARQRVGGVDRSRLQAELVLSGAEGAFGLRF